MISKERKIKRISVLILCTALLTTSLFSAFNVWAAGGYDYPLALKDSIIFYDANKCGNDVLVDQAFSWRTGPCHLTDGKDVGVDLTGGFHDAGDHVKFGLPQAFTASILGWSMYEYKDVFDATNNTGKLMEQLKYFTDYFLKSHPDANTFYYQVGDGIIDHQYWGAPELQTGDRPTLYVANASNPASDITGQTAAALALMYLNYKSIDSGYADKCLKAAKEIYTIGKIKTVVGSYQHFYRSTSPSDDMAWGAVWLYEATKNEQYLEESKTYALERNEMNEDPLKNNWTICWDNVYLAAHLKLAQLTGEQKFKTSVEYNLDYWLNAIETTPGGLKYLHYWAVLKYAAAESLIAMIYYKQSPDNKLLEMAKSQIDYILGDNPAKMSYEIGFGTKWSAYVHHRGAQGGQGYDNNADKTPAKYVLLGALIGGPDKTDTFKESVDEYQYTEVGLDYNAGFVGALAGIIKHYGSVVPSNLPSPSPLPSTSPAGCTVSGYIAPDFTFSSSAAPILKKGFKVEIEGTGIWTETDENGYFELKNVEPDSTGYTLKISKDSFMTREIKNVKVSSAGVKLSTESSPVLLWAGDIIKDDAINIADIMEVAKAFNTASTDAKYAVKLDLNRDNAINITDIMIITRHFNTSNTNYPAI